MFDYILRKKLKNIRCECDVSNSLHIIGNYFDPTNKKTDKLIKCNNCHKVFTKSKLEQKYDK